MYVRFPSALSRRVGFVEGIEVVQIDILERRVIASRLEHFLQASLRGVEFFE